MRQLSHGVRPDLDVAVAIVGANIGGDAALERVLARGGRLALNLGCLHLFVWVRANAASPSLVQESQSSALSC